MSKNNKRTIHVGTHNSYELYKNPPNNPDEEFSEEFVEISKNKITNEINKNPSNKRKNN